MGRPLLDWRIHSIGLDYGVVKGLAEREGFFNLWGVEPNGTEPNRRHCDMAARELQLDATIGCSRRLQT